MQRNTTRAQGRESLTHTRIGDEHDHCTSKYQDANTDEHTNASKDTRQGEALRLRQHNGSFDWEHRRNNKHRQTSIMGLLTHSRRPTSIKLPRNMNCVRTEFT